MRSHFRREIPFVKYRRVLFAISAVLIVASLVGVAVRGINLGIDFIGGTQVSFNDTGEISISEMRDAFSQIGIGDAVVQTTQTTDASGFLVSTGETDPSAANAHAAQVAEALGLAENSYQVTTIGPNWGSDVTRSSVIAFVVVIVLIVLFVSIRYEFKMSLMAVVSLLHVMVIVVGVYAWTQQEATPNVVAALLTIMGYCLYDTVVVFNRVNENMRTLKDGVHRTALQITNYSENQVIVRSINTALCSLVPVGAMLLFGGETLKGFAFAMFIGLFLGAYSSIAIAAPLYALWKGREDRWRTAERLYGEHGERVGKDGAAGTGASAATTGTARVSAVGSGQAATQAAPKPAGEAAAPSAGTAKPGAQAHAASQGQGGASAKKEASGSSSSQRKKKRSRKVY